jgi:hypothetical protein
MVYAVDSFLNNAVDLYIQAVEYCWISTSQISTPVGAGIRQMRLESGRHRRILEIPCQIQARLAGAAGSPVGSRPERLDPRQFWRNLRPGSSQNDGIPASWPEIGQDGRFPVNWPRSGRFLPDSSKDRRNPTKMARFRQLCRNLYLPNIKKLFLY